MTHGLIHRVPMTWNLPEGTGLTGLAVWTPL